MNSHTDRNLLLGILALQMDFIDREQLVAAMNAWVLDKSKSLDGLLLDQGALREDTHKLLVALVDKHLELHEGDPEKSLASLSSIGSVREDLQSIADPEIEATLSIIPEASSLQSSETMDPTGDHGAQTLKVDSRTSGGSRFRILRPHAKGGLGEVSVAEDIELKREVALKEIQERFADDPNSRARFLLEAEVTGGLEHPGIVPVYGLGQYGDGRPFYAMRFIRGDSLKEAADRFHKADWKDESARALEFRKLLGRFVDVCNAIEYAHSRGILHRDLKPGNVMLGKYGETLVVDWGLAKAVGRDDGTKVEGETTLRPVSGSGNAPTQMGSAIGTPAFMSPEQAAGRLDELGSTSDVYSLGATLYYLLTGLPPVQADNLEEILRRVQSGEYLSPRRVKSNLPESLEAICLRAMATKPDARYVSPKQLADDVDRYLADEPVTARREPFSLRARRWMRKHPKTVASLTAALFVSLGGTVVVAGVVSVKNQQLASANDVLDQSQLELQAKSQQLESSNQAIQQTNQQLQAEVKRANREERLANIRLYAFTIANAQREWDFGDPSLAWVHLNNCRLRGWEYDYLRKLFTENQRTLTGHTKSVTCIAVSPDGERVVSGSYDDTLKIWDAQSGIVERSIGRWNGVYSVAFSPDGRKMAAGDGGNRTSPVIKIFDLQTGQELMALEGHAESINSLAFSPDGERIASGSRDNTLKVWDVDSGDQLHSLVGHTEVVNGVAFSPDSRKVVSGSGDDTLKIWDAETGRELRTFQGHTDEVTSVAFGPDGKKIASGSRDSTLKIWDALTGQEQLTLAGHGGSVASVGFSPDGEELVSGSSDKKLKIWNVRTGQERFTLTGHSSYVTSVAFSPDGKNVFSGSGDKSVKIWNAQKKPGPLTIEDATPACVALSPNGKTIVSASLSTNRLAIWDTRTGREMRTLKGHSKTVHGVAFSRDGRRIASGSEDCTLKIWDVETGRTILTIEAETWVLRVAFSPDGSCVIGTQGKAIKVWDAETGQEKLTLDGHTGRVMSVAFSPDGTRIVSASVDSTVKMWDAETGQERFTLDGHEGTPFTASFSHDGTKIVSGGGKRGKLTSFGECIVWDAESGEETVRFKGHTDFVLSVAFSPDGKRIVSSSGMFMEFSGKPGELKVWDSETGQETLELKGHARGVHTAAFSLDGGRIVSGSYDKIQIWDAVNDE